MAGVAIRCNGSSSVTSAAGRATLQIPFPTDSEEFSSLTVEGKLGDFVQTRELSLAVRLDMVNIYTDKPLYQPGQTMQRIGIFRRIRLFTAGAVRGR
jgi:hypothetical protein